MTLLAGSPSKVAALEVALRPLLDACVPAALLELLRLLARLRDRGAPVVCGLIRPCQRPYRVN